MVHRTYRPPSGLLRVGTHSRPLTLNVEKSLTKEGTVPKKQIGVPKEVTYPSESRFRSSWDTAKDLEKEIRHGSRGVTRNV